MGRIRASFSHFLDVASEEVACSSGVLLSDANIRRLAGRYHITELRGITRSDGETVLRAEELEDAILRLRVAIGELRSDQRSFGELNQRQNIGGLLLITVWRLPHNGEGKNRPNPAQCIWFPRPGRYT